jgi:thymidine phosphorylase
MSDTDFNYLHLRDLGIDTSQESVIYMRPDCHVCRSEGFGPHARVEVRHGVQSIIATLHVIGSDVLHHNEASLSRVAWQRLRARDGDAITVRHAPAVDSLSFLRAKVYGHRLDDHALNAIIADIAGGQYSDIHVSSFVTACAGDHLDRREILGLTRAMVDVGDRLSWGITPIVDKHCVGGLPGNRTTPIIVAIVTAYGLTMPKTSSRAITSPAGTADTMETLAPVDLDLSAMRRVVEQEGGCIVWGGSVRLSPADDILIRVERALDIDSEGQLIASVLSKKAAAGSTHLVLDLPMGPTAKIRSRETAEALSDQLVDIAASLGMVTRTIITDGTQPIGRGIGPALEAREVLAVLQNKPDAPSDLKNRAVSLAAALIELATELHEGQASEVATSILADGQAWKKFQAICEAQGGMREPPIAPYTHPVESASDGRVTEIDNRLLARVAKLAGAPGDRAAGVGLNKKVGDTVRAGEPLFTIHAESPGELRYALDFAKSHPKIMTVGSSR